jgi:GNAT superfamily N-acetyltransferase
VEFTERRYEHRPRRQTKELPLIGPATRPWGKQQEFLGSGPTGAIPTVGTGQTTPANTGPEIIMLHHHTLRAAVESDRTALRGFFTALPPQTSFLRFFGDGFRATDAALDLLLGTRLPGRAFVAYQGDEIVGHALWSPWRNRPFAADLGLVVTDAWQRCGIGSRLVDMTIADALSSGVDRLEFSVLAENRATNRLVQRCWPNPLRVVSAGVVDYEIPLHAARAAA